MPLDPVLVDVLACPVDKGPLWWIEESQVLYNPRLRKVYAVNDGIPDMLVEDSTDASPADHERWAAMAAAGEVVVTGPAGTARPDPGGTAQTGDTGGKE